MIEPGAVRVMVGGLEHVVSPHRNGAARSHPTTGARPPRTGLPYIERRGDTDAGTDRIRLRWRKSETHGLLPDPDPRPIRYTLFSTDDHLVEPPHMFEGRLPAKLQAEAPRVVETDEGHEVWQFDGKIFFQVGLNAVVGRKTEDWLVEPTRFEEMRTACYEVNARVRDMDINGVWASVQLPVADHRLLRLGVLALCRPRARPRRDAGVERLVLRRVVFAASRSHGSDGHHVSRRPRSRARDEIRRNAARGFTAVTLPEMPHRIGMEPIFSEWWDPIIDACADTDTVICLHVGSTGVADMPKGAPMVPLGATLFGQLSLSACAEWLWSGYAVKHPDLKIIMSEGGIGWVAMLHDRLENIVDRSGYGALLPR